MASILQEESTRIKSEQALVSEIEAAEETNHQRHCESCGQNAELQLLLNASQQALAQSQAHVGRLSDALVSAGSSNQVDRLQVGKLHLMLSARIYELEYASARAIELEHSVQTERLNHHATREKLVDEKGRHEVTIREVQQLRNMQKASDRVLRALYETNNTSDKRSLSNLMDQTMQEIRKDETAMDKIESNHMWQEGQLLLQHRAAALDARERALEQKEGLSYAPVSSYGGLVGFQNTSRNPAESTRAGSSTPVGRATSAKSASPNWRSRSNISGQQRELGVQSMVATPTSRRMA